MVETVLTEMSPRFARLYADHAADHRSEAVEAMKKASIAGYRAATTAARLLDLFAVVSAESPPLPALPYCCKLALID
jgi:hypothetical protein